MINNNQKKIYYSRRRIYINIMKTTFDFNLALYLAFKQHGYTCTCTCVHGQIKSWKQKESVNKHSFSMITFKLAIKT